MQYSVAVGSNWDLAHLEAQIDNEYIFWYLVFGICFFFLVVSLRTFKNYEFILKYAYQVPKKE